MKAPEQIPKELLDGYTMSGKAKIEYKYANDCSEEIQKITDTSIKDIENLSDSKESEILKV